MNAVQANNVDNSRPGPDVRVFEEALPGSLFERLVRGVRVIGDDRLKKNYTTTFWMPKDAKPTNVAEEAVLALLELLKPLPSYTGVEWWLGRLKPGEKLRLHFDRDMTIKKKTGQFVHPLFGSVLYLNTFPHSPTVILDQVTAPDGKSRIPEKSESRQAIDAVSNRYIAFPGNRRHGVIPDTNAMQSANNAQDAIGTAERRLTLLVNLWDRRPLPPICFDYDGSIYGQLRDNQFFSGNISSESKIKPV